MNVIAERPPAAMYATGLEIDCQCARCGSSVDFELCEYCEDGLDGHDCGEDCCCCLNPEENVVCQYCLGSGVSLICMASPEWCDGHPLAGRKGVNRGDIAWFTTEAP